MKKIIFNSKFGFANSDQNVKKSRISLWERYNRVAEYRNALETRIIDRAERDRKKGNLKKAIERYEGFFQFYSVNQNIHNKVAELYIEIDDKKRAGRHLFFKEYLSESEKDCIACFTKSCGNSPTIILKKTALQRELQIKRT